MADMADMSVTRDKVEAEQVVYSGTDGIISVTCLVAGMIGAGFPPATVAVAASIAAFADAISMGISEFNARGDVRKAIVTVLAFYAFALAVVSVAARAQSPLLVFGWSAACVLALALLKRSLVETSSGPIRDVGKTVAVSVAGTLAAYWVGSLHA